MQGPTTIMHYYTYKLLVVIITCTVYYSTHDESKAKHFLPTIVLLLAAHHCILLGRIIPHFCCCCTYRRVSTRVTLVPVVLLYIRQIISFLKLASLFEMHDIDILPKETRWLVRGCFVTVKITKVELKRTCH